MFQGAGNGASAGKAIWDIWQQSFAGEAEKGFQSFGEHSRADSWQRGGEGSGTLEAVEPLPWRKEIPATPGILTHQHQCNDCGDLCQLQGCLGEQRGSTRAGGAKG